MNKIKAISVFSSAGIGELLLKNTNVDDVNKLSSNFNNMKDNAYVCVLGSKEKILSNSDLFRKTIEIK